MVAYWFDCDFRPKTPLCHFKKGAKPLSRCLTFPCVARSLRTNLKKPQIATDPWASRN